MQLWTKVNMCSKPALNEETKLCHSDRVAYAESYDGSLILGDRLNKSVRFQVTGIAVDAFLLVDGVRSTSEIIKMLAYGYDVDQDDVKKDTMAFFSKLLELDLLDER